MSSLSSCQKCRGFVPPASAECVHCGAPMLASAPAGGVMLKGLFCLAGASVAAITLMACYGMPPCDTPPPDGGSDMYHCYDMDPCGPSSQDGGTAQDGGSSSCDGMVNMDGGVDAGH
jgi:hypothetical protein